MTQLRDLAASKRDYFGIDPRIIMVDPTYNIRDLDAPAAKAGIAEMVESIAENVAAGRPALNVPMLVRMHEGAVYVVQGHRRLASLRIAIERGVPIEEVDCIPEATRPARDPGDRTLDLFLSNDGAPLTELEKAEGVRRLAEVHGWDDAKIAARLGKGPGYVRHLKSLLTMPEAVQEMVRNDQVAAATALQTVRSEGEAAAEVLSVAIADTAAEAPQAPLASKSGETIVEAPKPRKTTPRAIEKAAEKVAARQGRERAPKKTKAQPQPKALKAPVVGYRLDEALFAQITKFLVQCQNGHYEDEEHEVPSRLTADATELSKTIKSFRNGFRSEAAE